jgi:hypothetical protein
VFVDRERSNGVGRITGECPHVEVRVRDDRIVPGRPASDEDQSMTPGTSR